MAFYMRSPVYTPNDPVKSVKQLHSWLYQLNENLKFMFSNLDSDNFTSEFSACFSEESVMKTQEEIKKLDEAVREMSQECAWETLALSGFFAGGDQDAPRILNLGGQAYVAGEATILSPLPAGSNVILAQLSQKHRPRIKQESFCRWGKAFLILTVHENGEISVFNPLDEAVDQNAALSFSFSYGL